jgi:hypothetical protein
LTQTLHSLRQLEQSHLTSLHQHALESLESTVARSSTQKGLQKLP